MNDPGELNDLVLLQSPGTMQDAAGQPLATWTTVARVWADVRYQTGLERVRAGAVSTVVQASVRIRWRPGVTPAQRLVLDGRPMAIKSVLPDREKEHLDLVCEELQ